METQHPRSLFEPERNEQQTQDELRPIAEEYAVEIAMLALALNSASHGKSALHARRHVAGLFKVEISEDTMREAQMRLLAEIPAKLHALIRKARQS
jgi:hypothetical protein